MPEAPTADGTRLRLWSSSSDVPKGAGDYFPQLDGVRALAVATVLVGHFAPPSFMSPLVSWGDSGVILFFCLSGFLITRILLRSRLHGTDSRWRQLTVFYARRAVRIFPIYYITIAVVALLGYEHVRNHWLRLVTYSTNTVPGLPRVYLGMASHFWSLAVEEQFYLFWPLLIMFLPTRWIARGILGAVFVSVSYKLIGLGLHLDYFQLVRPVYGCMDSLGFGAILAVFTELPGWDRFRGLFGKACLSIGIPWVIVLTTYRLYNEVDPFFAGSLWLAVSLMWGYVVASTGLVAYATEGRGGIVARFLAIPSLCFVGRISYGIYVYHFFMPAFSRWLVYVLGLPAPPWAMFLLNIACSVILAMTSWRIIEQPCLRLKALFTYRSRHIEPKYDGKELRHAA